MRHYNYEELGEDCTSEDILALEKNFGLQNVEWKFSHCCVQEVNLRAFYALMRYLTTLGTLIVKSDDGELEACLQVAERSLRMQGRPRGRVEDRDQVGFQDDDLLLEINDQDKDKFNVAIYCVNCHYYNPENITIKEASDPMAYPRAVYLVQAIRKAPLKVFKSGSATGPTSGELVSLTGISPPEEDNSNEEDEGSSSEDKDQEEEEEESEDNEDSEDGDGEYKDSESEDEAEDLELGDE
ncbi:hypothetical protein MMC31_000873 [Peltigera leucophlebia]|nr:hypothetical protein [Peltigera leucophlebia]